MVIETLFLTGNQGHPQALKVAEALAGFIARATASIHLAIYDFRLSKDDLKQPVVDALRDRAAAGVSVRIAFDAGKAEPDHAGADPAPEGTHAFLEAAFKDTPVEIKAIHGQKLMHNKYVVRDGHTKQATLWTGSANFTDDAWTLQESNIITIASPELCDYYETDFGELWQTGAIGSTGVGDTGTVDVDGTRIQVLFAPGEGQTIDAEIVGQISAAKREIRLSSMVLTSHSILAALAQAIDSGLHVTGTYDKTQMDGVKDQWRQTRSGQGIIQTFEFVASKLVGKNSTKYAPHSPHDFMHNKVVVCDDTVVTGSFNFSRSATMNSENVLIISNAELAQRYRTYLAELVTLYSGT